MTTMFRTLRPFAPALLCLTGIACVTYPVTPVNELQPGHTVELTLSDSTIPAMAPRLGPGVFRLTGKLQEIDSLALPVDVSRTTSTRDVSDRVAPSVHWNGDAVSIPRAGIVNARQGHVSAALIAAGATLVAGSIAFMVSRSHHPAIATVNTFP